MIRFLVLVPALVAGLAVLARADIVHLKNGGRLKGQVIEQTATHVVLRTKLGAVMKIERSKIERIEKTRDVWDEYAERREKTPKDDAAALFELYRWCVENELERESKNVLEEVLQADPNHVEARKVKGHVRIDDRWTTAEEAKRADYRLHEGQWLSNDDYMKATGHVKYGSDWIPEKEYDRLFTKGEMEKLLMMELTVENSEHFGVRTRFPKEHANQLLQLAEDAYAAFMKVLPYPETTEWRRIEIYVFADLDEYQRYFDRYVFPRRLIPDAEAFQHYREAGNCNLFFPKPIIVLRRSPALPQLKDQAALMVHNIGHMMLHRMRKEIYPPDWLEEGMGHWCEEQVFGVARK